MLAFGAEALGRACEDKEGVNAPYLLEEKALLVARGAGLSSSLVRVRSEDSDMSEASESSSGDESDVSVASGELGAPTSFCILRIRWGGT